MRAVTFDISIPRYVVARAAGAIHRGLYYRYPALSAVRYGAVGEPRLPGPGWVRIRTRMGGICGSDLNLVFLHDSPATTPFASFPFVIGHENVGEVLECGSGVTDLRPGDRVTVDPLLPCGPRGIDPPCPRCAEGHYPQCENFAAGALAPGLLIGGCRDTGGSWGEHFVAHRSQVFRVPDHLSDADALLTEPLAVALHPVLKDPPRPGERVLVIGAGVIGLLLVAAIRAMAHDCRVAVLCRHGFQGRMAEEFGADAVISAAGDYYTGLAREAGARLYRPMIGKRVSTGGFDRIYDCVGSAQSLDDSLRLARAGGTVAVVGLAALPRGVDWTAVWLKELTIRGTFTYGHDVIGQAPERTFAAALRLVAEGRVQPGPLLTHTFPLHRYREAIRVASQKGRHRSIKVAFQFV